MAIESQGIIISRESTVAGESTSITAATLAFSSANEITASAGDMSGFSTDMRVYTNATSNSANVVRLVSVAATSLVTHHTVTTQSFRHILYHRRR